ncbi:unnamed protein product, partial [Nesidiocoris tenuis]
MRFFSWVGHEFEIEVDQSQQCSQQRKKKTDGNFFVGVQREGWRTCTPSGFSSTYLLPGHRSDL